MSRIPGRSLTYRAAYVPRGPLTPVVYCQYVVSASAVFATRPGGLRRLLPVT
jgi:hypothetical protein